MKRDPHSIVKARALRREMTPAERILWSELRGRRFAGFKFRRQHTVGAFIMDFYCAEAALVVELDGESHVGKELPDQWRQQRLEALGLKVFRVWNTDVYEDRDVVMEAIWQECESRRATRTPHPRPLSPEYRGEGSKGRSRPRG